LQWICRIGGGLVRAERRCTWNGNNSIRLFVIVISIIIVIRGGIVIVIVIIFSGENSFIGIRIVSHMVFVFGQNMKES
jgi:hypothetical protein